jgi:hypothetical protein
MPLSNIYIYIYIYIFNIVTELELFFFFKEKREGKRLTLVPIARAIAETLAEASVPSLFTHYPTVGHNTIVLETFFKHAIEKLA